MTTNTTCDACGQEMTYTWTCERSRLHRRGEPVDLVRWWSADYPGPLHRTGRCPECAVFQGGFHHAGCPVATCPMCTQVFEGCGCWFDERPAAAA